MDTEADTCRKVVAPMLVEAGWETAPHAINEQRTFTDGRVLFVDKAPYCKAMIKSRNNSDFDERFSFA